MIVNLIAEIVTPTMALALTAGPAQPEFSSFEPVATTDMVNDFSGDFTYNLPVLNIPGPDGGGYSMSLSYHSGASSEEEASWVGFGWTLNPGAINRGKRGYPDEYYETEVINYNKTRPNWTQTSKFDFNMELHSKDQNKKNKEAKDKKKGESTGKMLTKFKLTNFSDPAGSGDESDSDEEDGPPFPISISLSHRITFNNYSGFSIGNSIGVQAGGMGNLSMNSSGGQKTLGFSVNPMAIMEAMSKQKKKDNKIEGEKKWKSKLGKGLDKANHMLAKLSKKTHVKNIPTGYSAHTYAVPALPYSVANNSAASWNFSGSIQVNPNIPVGFQVGVSGNMNIQANEAESRLKAFGYMGSERANAHSNKNTPDELYDYQIEKATTYNKHDKYLGIPFNNADLFSASGNAVMGGFKFHHDAIGSYYPNYIENETKIRQLSVELGIGATFQIGIDLGVGKQNTITGGKWPFPNQTSYINREFSSGLPLMRFTNDPGGELIYDGDYNKNLFAKVDLLRSLVLNNDYALVKDGNKYGNSSDIEYVMAASQHSVNNYITGIKITDKAGEKCNYLQPVYTRNELQLTVGLDNNEDGKYVVTQPVNVKDPLENTTAVGEFAAQQYASSYLITSKTSANYIDIGNNGPDENDFGGWTKFAYKQKWGADADNWYRFRSPYNGLLYNQGRMLDDNDQTGSLSAGEKQIYYLKNIETKTHAAFFVTNAFNATTFTINFPQADYPYLYSGGQPIPNVLADLTGSGTVRLDGLDAAGTYTSGLDSAAENLTAKGCHVLERLEKIVLFAKADVSKSISSTHFEYDYSLCQGIPNSRSTNASPANEKGKLTLKRVWTESGGVSRNQIAPYQFHYEYFNQYPAGSAFNHYWIAGYNAMPTNDKNQNPEYVKEQLDAWGNYQEDGDKRFEKMQQWLSQQTFSANTTFDPAAWQLKRIQLPSGGEIHVHYEQKDYAYVQDEVAMAMVSLLSGPTGDQGYKSDESTFTINTDDLGIANDAGGITAYAGMLKKYFLTENNKLYYKALYNYTGDDVPTLHSKTERSEYVTGYTSVNEITVNGSLIEMSLGDKRKPLATALTKGKSGKTDKTLPRFVCYQNLMNNGGQNLGMNAMSYKDDQFLNEAYGSNPDIKAAARNKVWQNTFNMFADWVGGKVKNAGRPEACKVMNMELSYFKLPVYHAKRGGGVRVKRLLTYDPGIEGDPSVYGSEYLYESENGTSSGVATNEPASIREESALVKFLEQKKQKFFDKLVNGRNTKDFEGPLGESLLPAPEIGHSRIVIKNIRNGISTSGYTVNKYHTAKDFPMEVEFSEISKKNDTYKKFKLELQIEMFNLSTNRAWVTQGYTFKKNDMHGKIESKTVYPGLYEPSKFQNPVNQSTPYSYSTQFKAVAKSYKDTPGASKNNTGPAFTNQTLYYYSEPGQKIKSMLYNSGVKKFTKDDLSPGTEEDITIFTSAVTERTADFHIEVDINVSFMPVVLTLGLGANFAISDNLMAQHVTSKVVSYKTYLMKTSTVQGGVYQTSENLAFDRYTGDPVLTRTFDDYRSPQDTIRTQKSGTDDHAGYFYALNIPASWAYPTMGPLSISGTNKNQLSQMAGSIVNYGNNSLYNTISAAGSVTWNPATLPLENIVSASATTYSNNWFTAGMNTTYPGISGALTAANSMYYPVQTYNYRDKVISANVNNGKIYEGGVTQNPLKFFDWSATSHPGEWYSDGKVTRYSPYGYPIEEEDVLSVKSSAHFGYKETLPVAVAQNAGFTETKFIDFEHGFNMSATPAPPLTTQLAHSGARSLDLSLAPQHKFVQSYFIGTNLLQRGVGIKLWLHSSLSQVPNNVNYRRKNANPQLKAKIGGQLYDFKALAQTGEWTLYAADIRNFGALSAGYHDVELSYAFANGNERVLVDDFRIQPLDASMNCSVYYPDNKLAAQFDDQHFGVFYEYNSQGQLVRKSIETERGKKTLQEQQYNTPLINRN